MRQIIIPADKTSWLEMRSRNINSTEVAALFGVSEYATPFELFHQKKGNCFVNFEGNERTEWGLALQKGIAEKVAKDNGWNIRQMDEYIYDDELKYGSSFDFAINDDGLLEIKNIDYLVFKDKWTEDENGNIQASLQIEAQIQHQLLVSGRSYCMLAALVGGNRLVLIKRTRDEAVIQAIRERVAAFWASIEANTPPSPDFKEDAEFIGKLFGYAEPGKVIDVSGDESITSLAKEYRDLGEQIKTATDRREAIQAELLTVVGDAEKITGDGFSIDAGITGPAHVEFDRKAFRRFTVRFKKDK